MNKEILAALISLSPLSMTLIAKQAKIDQGNLSIWLKDDRSFSYAAQQRLESVLGIEEGLLVTDRVFFWKTDRDFSALQTVLDNVFPNAKLQPVVKTRVKRYDLSDLFSQPMTMLTNELGHRAVILLKTPLVQELKNAANPPWVSPEFLKGTEWLYSLDESQKYPYPEPLQLEKEMYVRWKKGDIGQVEFNQFLSMKQAVTWSTIVDEAIRLSVSPEQLLELLQKKYG